MKKIILLFLFFLFLNPNRVLAIDPQYIFVRKDPMSCNPSDCSQLWNMNNPNLDFYPGIVDVYNKVGTHGTDQRQLGIGVLVYYNEYNFENVKNSLQSLLTYSQVHAVPLFIALDGFQWWDMRPDLWNWWDPSAPGYNSDNKNNVEWTNWDSSYAIRKSWRNWGSEFEVKPHPNLASRAFIDSNKEKLGQLIPIIVNWYNNKLTSDKKWLLGGIALGNEIDIGANYYYYPNGISNGGGLQNSVQLGYAAVKTSGIKSSGQITSADLNEVVERYLQELNKTAFDLGIPRNKIFNHVGGQGLAPFINYPPNVAFVTSTAALNDYAQPGWSFYGDVTTNPQNFPLLNSVLDQIGNSSWASPEWLTWAGDYNGWIQALRNSLNYRNNRFINIANWEGIRDKQYVLDALKTVLDESPPCWVTSPVLNSPAISGRNVTLSWQNGQNNVATYLNASTVGDFGPSGTLKNMDVINSGATGTTTHNLSNLSPGKYYWAVVSDGCSPVQRRIANGRFEITAGKVDISNLRSLLKNFTNIFDYDILVGNYGQPSP